MDGISVALLSLLHCSAVAKPIVAARLARRNLALKYPLLIGSLAAGAAIQSLLLYSYWTGGWKAYGRAWAATTPFSFAVSMGITLEALSVMARHFPKARNLAMALIAIFGTMTAAAVLPLGRMVDDTLWLLTVRAYWKVAALGVLAGVRLFLGSIEPAMRENVRRYVAGVLLCMAGSAAGDVIISIARPNYWGIALGQFTLLLVPVVGYLRWWQMSAAGENFTPTPRPTMEQLDGEMARLDEEIRAYGKSAGE